MPIRYVNNSLHQPVKLVSHFILSEKVTQSSLNTAAVNINLIVSDVTSILRTKEPVILLKAGECRAVMTVLQPDKES